MRLAVVVLALLLAACQPSGAPHLVAVTGVSNERLAEGDLLELVGSGFPEGRPARLTLRGDVYRSESAVERGFELVLPARSPSPHAVASDVTRAVERALCGPTFEHATFRGAIEVAFFPPSAGAPPVTGGLAAVVIDFVPAGAPRSPSRSAEVERFLEFSGLLLTAQGGELLVDGIMPKSRAERAGVVKGDRLVELAGLRLLDRSELVPPARARQVELVVRRAGAADARRLVLDVDGFRRWPARDLAAIAGMLAVVLAIFGLLRSPFGRALSFFELRLVAAFRAERERAEAWGPRARAVHSRTVRRFTSALPATPACYLALAAVVAALAWTAAGGAIVAREVDAVVLWVSSLVSVMVGALLFGASGERGLLARLRRALLVLGQGIPVLLALACAAIQSGGFGLDELVLAQGALPWEWNAFRGPAALAGALVLLVSLVPETGFARSEAFAGGQRQRQRAVPEVVGWTYLLVVSGLAALGFFGGPRLPGVLPGAVQPLGVALAGAAVLVLKTVVFAALVLVARWALGRVDVTETKGLLFRVLTPAAACALGLAALLERAEWRAASEAAGAALGLSSFVAVTLVGALLARRVALGTLGRETEPGVNPWI